MSISQATFETSMLKPWTAEQLAAFDKSQRAAQATYKGPGRACQCPYCVERRRYSAPRRTNPHSK